MELRIAVNKRQIESVAGVREHTREDLKLIAPLRLDKAHRMFERFTPPPTVRAHRSTSDPCHSQTRSRPERRITSFRCRSVPPQAQGSVAATARPPSEPGLLSWAAGRVESAP